MELLLSDADLGRHGLYPPIMEVGVERDCHQNVGDGRSVRLGDGAPAPVRYCYHSTCSLATPSLFDGRSDSDVYFCFLFVQYLAFEEEK